MILTGRVALLALLGAVVVGVAIPSVEGIALVAAVLLVLVLFDVAWAAPVRSLEISRSGDTTVRLSETATVSLRVYNTARRQLHGTLRDAWPPSAGVEPDRFMLTIAPGDRQLHDLTLRPTRRGDRHADRVTVRSMGPLGLAGRQGSHAIPWRLECCRLSTLVSTCRRGWPSFASWTDGRPCASVGAGRSSIRSVST